MDFVLIVLAIAAACFGLLAFWLFSRASGLQRRLVDLEFSKSSQSVKYGKLTEQWIPFSDAFPFDRQQFRFLGSPIDGVAFDENKIVFVEFKTGQSQLNENQKKIKKLVLDKKVDWLEFKIK
ncbi:MAG: hypothetical protein J4215_01360 [Candidatus Diapherotrites archaeon]|uniref:Holliday junction resolvase-related domain-containing protein n=1 Tax=Candidatus Iainarchaeum sp. TaxID=3101447 RepID=A0A8T4L1S1_9ARCH|nr:hypothetical protein [Candidatus Diapherotrites archaeon]